MQSDGDFVDVKLLQTVKDKANSGSRTRSVDLRRPKSEFLNIKNSLFFKVSLGSAT
jgi:hypothetical protein